MFYNNGGESVMILYCISPSGFQQSVWHTYILNGLLDEKRIHRFSIVMLESGKELNNFTIAFDDFLMIIGSDNAGLKKIDYNHVQKFGNRIIVLGSCERNLSGFTYSSVIHDDARDLTNLYLYLTENGKRNIALYGIYPNSSSDLMRVKSFCQLNKNHDDIFYNNGNLKECFNQFYDKINKYDGIICANDYCAISLIIHLREKKNKLPYIVSCSESMIGEIFSPRITNLKTNYHTFAKVGIRIAKNLLKNDKINTINVYFSKEIIPRESTNMAPVKHLNYSEFNIVKNIEEDNSFYEDSEVAEMVNFEMLMNSLDDSGKKIFELLCNKESYSAIAEKLFMSVNGVKYRVQKMFSMLGVTTRADFAQFIDKYI